MLADRYPEDWLKGSLLSIEGFRPFPTAAERREWEGLPGELKESLISSGESALAMEWPRLPATHFMQFKRNGNRSGYEAASFTRRNMLTALVLAEAVEGNGRYMDHAVDGIWAICEESFWGVPAHNDSTIFNNAALPDTAHREIDLFAAETSTLLAITHYLLKDGLDSVSPVIRDRIRREVVERIIDPHITRDDFWWMGFTGREVNNWNPWINSNILISLLLLEESGERRTMSVHKVLRSLDTFINGYQEDGGCDEGTSYWGHAGGSLLDCLEHLHAATDGGIDIYDEPIIGNIGRYLYRMNISGEYFVNFADGGAKVGIPADLVYRYGRRVGDPKLMSLGACAFGRIWSGTKSFAVVKNLNSINRILAEVFGFSEILDASSTCAPGDALVEDSWLPGIQVMAAREQDGSDRGLFVAAKGGHNGESHNHNDIGQFLVYCDGVPGIVDIGVEVYTAKTFGPKRYEIWTMQSAYHNLPTIGGVQQAPGTGFKASSVEYGVCRGTSRLSMDISMAYPESAGLVSWNREVALNRKDTAPARVTVKDSFVLREPKEVRLSLICARKPQVTGRDTVIVPGNPMGSGAICISWSPGYGSIAVEELPVEDARLRPVWGDKLHRVLMGPEGTVMTGDLELIIGKA